MIDVNYGADGDLTLREQLLAGANPNMCAGPAAETLLHVAVRRRRKSAVELLIDHGADVNARNGNDKTGYAHAIRRGFTEISDLLAHRGADTSLNVADQLAVAIVTGDLNTATVLLEADPQVARTGNPGEDRLLADLAGRNPTEPVRLLIDAGADLNARGLDDGTALHQAAWFGQPSNAQLLIEAGAPLEVFDAVHHCSPLGWAVHGARYSGAADERLDDYSELVRMLLEAGASLHYPGDQDGKDYFDRLMKDASPAIATLLRQGE